MRLSTVLVSSVFVLAGTSTALPVKRENMLVARFVDTDFLSEVEPRAYDNAHGSAISTNNYKPLSRHRRSFYEPPSYKFTRRGIRSDGYDMYAKQSLLHSFSSETPDMMVQLPPDPDPPPQNGPPPQNAPTPQNGPPGHPPTNPNTHIQQNPHARTQRS